MYKIHMGNMVNAGIGIQLGREIMNQVNETMQQNNNYSNTQNNASQKSEATSEGGNSNIPKFCPNCGTKTNGMKFCGECGYKLI